MEETTWQDVVQQRDALAEAARAVLLFHTGGDWGETKRQEWYTITGQTEATTRTLCDFVRCALAKVE